MILTQGLSLVLHAEKNIARCYFIGFDKYLKCIRTRYYLTFIVGMSRRTSCI